MSDPPVGTVAWTVLKRDQLLSALQDVRFNNDLARGLYEQIKAHGAWHELHDMDGQTFRSFEQFCRSANGLKMAREQIEGKLTAQQMAGANGVRRLMTRVEAGKLSRSPAAKRQDKARDISRGNTLKEYLVARLKRDHPDIARRLAAGEFPTAAAAARAPGFGRSCLIPLRSAWKHASPGERSAFLIEIGAVLVDKADAAD